MNNLSKQISIVLVHTGHAPLPDYLLDNVIICAQMAPMSRICVLLDEANAKLFQAQIGSRSFSVPLLERVEIFCINNIPMSELSGSYAKTSKLDREFRGGFWFAASNRFLVIADFMQFLNLENCLHIENDVVLYFDPTNCIEAFAQLASFSVPLDRIRAIPGIVWLKTPEVAQELARHLAKNQDKSDMFALADFCLERPEFAKPLPTMPLEYAKANHLDIKRYSEAIDNFGGIFDAAAIGQYIGGVHWMNEPDDTRFFINESSDLDLSQCQFFWSNEGDVRLPYIAFQGVRTRILAIHAHSKNILGISPNNRSVLRDADEMITGERIQALADLTISSREVTAFHGRENITTKLFLEIPEKEKRKLFKVTRKIVAPEMPFLNLCREAKIIFVYTHLLPYFKKYIAPRLIHPFVLISHNSDDGVTLADLELLNHPQLVSWYAQNVEFSHAKLKGLPIGMANRQWGEERLAVLFEVSKSNQKTKTLYVNFNASTHPDRHALTDGLRGMEDITISERTDFANYVRALSEHQFCLCPRGNGIDTHRFWEAQYLNCIPIIRQSDWTPAYSNLPVLVVNTWDELKEIDLQKAYIRLSTTDFDRKSLSLHTIASTLDRLRRAHD